MGWIFLTCNYNHRPFDLDCFYHIFLLVYSGLCKHRLGIVENSMLKLQGNTVVPSKFEHIMYHHPTYCGSSYDESELATAWLRLDMRDLD